VESTKGLELRVHLFELLSGVLDGLDLHTLHSLLAAVPLTGAHLALGLKLVDNVSVLPADLGGETAQNGVFASGLQVDLTESVRHNNALKSVVRGRDTLEDLEAVHGSGTAGGLVRDHTTDNTVEDLGRSTLVERTVLRVGVGALVLELEVLELVAHERTSHHDALGADTHDFLTVQQLLGDHRGQTTKDVVTAINDNTLEMAERNVRRET